MASGGRIYKVRNPWKTVLTVILVIILAAVVLFVSLFLSFRKYIVYSDSGVRLEVPWLMEEEEEEGQLIVNS